MDTLPLVSRWQVVKNARGILKNPLPFHHANFKRYGDSFRVRLVTDEKILFTRNPGLIKHVLQKQHKIYHKSPLQTVDLAKYIGHGILTSNGEHWRIHRRMVQPAFHKKKLQALLFTMQEAIGEELKRIEPNKVQDVFPLMGDLAFQVVAKSLFSNSGIRDQMTALKRITDANQRMLIKEMRQPYLRWWYNLSGQVDRHLEKAKQGRALIQAIVDGRRKEGERDDLLDMLLQARYEDGSPMSDKQLVDEVLILFTAGHETTANVLSFCLFLLAKHQDVQERAYQEVQQVDQYGNDTLETLGGLSLIKHCLEEAMRLYPPVYVIDRIAMEDDVYDGIMIPKDSLVLMSVYELHRSAKNWERPAAFHPDRFKDVDKKAYTDYYYPFGAGPRMCVGNNFAMYEMVLAIAQIVKAFRLTTHMDQLKIVPLISLKPHTVPIMFKVR
ncbi:MAG: cytochrome P450 [Sediminicola sp.]|tara:strand:+ start:21314 stop:22636 length:1323 start_codon:yes stop_codon:yes gene_type:complete